MTGFGSADGTFGGAHVSVEVRSVNHRYFNASIKLPGDLARWETEVREAMRRRVSRGHVTLTARVDRGELERARVDEAQFTAYVEQIRALQARFAPQATLDLGDVLRLPNVIASSDSVDEGTAAELIGIVDRAIAALDAMRTSEGSRLLTYLRDRLRIIDEAVGRIDERAPQRLVEQRERLRAAVQELAGGVAIDEQRIAQEIAMLADRLDVSEEVSRFHSHITEFRATLGAASPEGVGKRLGFLLQELLREANTTGSKANDAAMQCDVISIKEELERIREQVENLE